MCRNIKTLHNFEPSATNDEIRASSLQFVRKLCGFTKPSHANEAAFDRAVDDVAHAAQHLLDSLITVYGKGKGAVKAFCMNCGSSLFGGDWPDGPQVSIRMGAFDDDPGIRPQFHTFVADRAPWDTISDNLPQYCERRT